MTPLLIEPLAPRLAQTLLPVRGQGVWVLDEALPVSVFARIDLEAMIIRFCTDPSVGPELPRRFGTIPLITTGGPRQKTLIDEVSRLPHEHCEQREAVHSMLKSHLGTSILPFGRPNPENHRNRKSRIRSQIVDKHLESPETDDINTLR